MSARRVVCLLRLSAGIGFLGCSDEHPRSAPRDASFDAPGDDAGGALDAAANDARAPETDAASDGGAPADGGAPYPRLLSQTGLFEDIASETLAPGVRFFQPAHALWSDGATKRRWISLPAGESIDTSNQDFWTYPAGTKVWKEFSVGDTRVETRLLHKAGPSSTDWVMVAYAWDEARGDAVAVPGGVQNARGTNHDIPAQEACLFCHGNMPDRLLGFTAVQLSHDRDGVTLQDLIDDDRLSDPPPSPIVLPGDAATQSALGYLHANCGNCHNRTSEVFETVDMNLWQSAAPVDSLADTAFYRSAVDQPTPGAEVNRIVPGVPARSMIYVRMTSLGTGQMPPIARETVDTSGAALVAAFIESLAPAGDGGAGDGGADEGGDVDDGGAALPDATVGD